MVLRVAQGLDGPNLGGIDGHARGLGPFLLASPASRCSFAANEPTSQRANEQHEMPMHQLTQSGKLNKRDASRLLLQVISQAAGGHWNGIRATGQYLYDVSSASIAILCDPPSSFSFPFPRKSRPVRELHSLRSSLVNLLTSNVLVSAANKSMQIGSLYARTSRPSLPRPRA